MRDSGEPAICHVLPLPARAAVLRCSGDWAGEWKGQLIDMREDSPATGPLIDILIPAYNAAETLRESVACMQRQTLADIRIIVVDDGSSDATGAILRELAAGDPRVIVHTQPNGGIVSALNTGLTLATAPFIARHDADDIAYPDRLERQLAYLQENPDCVAVGANAWHIDARGQRLGSRTTFAGPVDADPAAIPSQEPYLMHPFLLMRREALVAVGGYRYCFHSEDTDLYWRLLDRGGLFNLPDILGEYRLHAASISSVSVANGRVAAKYAQLAAVSFMRRKQGRQDLPFKREDQLQLHAFPDLKGVINHGADRLRPEEQDYVAIATAAQMIGLAAYRPYILEVDDCRQINQYLATLDSVPPAQRRLIRRNQAEVLRRYIDEGHWRQIAALRLPASVYLRLPQRYLWKARKALAARRRAA